MQRRRAEQRRGGGKQTAERVVRRAGPRRRPNGGKTGRSTHDAMTQAQTQLWLRVHAFCRLQGGAAQRGALRGCHLARKRVAVAARWWASKRASRSCLAITLRPSMPLAAACGRSAGRHSHGLAAQQLNSPVSPLLPEANRRLQTRSTHAVNSPNAACHSPGCQDGYRRASSHAAR